METGDNQGKKAGRISEARVNESLAVTVRQLIVWCMHSTRKPVEVCINMYMSGIQDALSQYKYSDNFGV